MTINDRIKEVRGSLTREDFCEDLDISAQTLYKYEKGTGKPSIEFVEEMCKKFNLQFEWLISGRGEKYKKKAEPENLIMQHNHHSNANSITVGSQLIEEKKCSHCQKLEQKLQQAQEENKALQQQIIELQSEYLAFVKSHLKN